MSICEKLLKAVARYDLISPGDRLLLGVSGGQDSVTLTLLLAELAAQLQITLVVGPLHHGLRGEQGDADQQFVADLAAKLRLPFVAEKADVGALADTLGCGVEAAGRIARYRFFQRAAREHHCNKIALGHTGTDRAETMLINLFRGSGLHGLRGMPPRRDNIIRPLILMSRQETGEYCRSCNLTVCHDVYNADPHYLRNRLRADLLPQLERDYGPGIEAALCRAADSLWDELEWTEPLVEQALSEAAQPGHTATALSAAALRAMPGGLRHRVLRRFVQQASYDLSDISSERWQAVEELLERSQTGRRAELGHGRYVQLSYDSFGVSGPNEAFEAPADLPQPFLLPVPGRVQLPDGTLVQAELTHLPPRLPAAQEFTAVLDAQKAQAGGGLLLRKPRPGDRFRPLGMAGSKKLHDFFVDNKVPRRERAPLLVTQQTGEILWVAGHRLAETAKVDDSTSIYLILSVSV